MCACIFRQHPFLARATCSVPICSIRELLHACAQHKSMFCPGLSSFSCCSVRIGTLWTLCPDILKKRGHFSKIHFDDVHPNEVQLCSSLSSLLIIHNCQHPFTWQAALSPYFFHTPPCYITTLSLHVLICEWSCGDRSCNNVHP